MDRLRRNNNILSRLNNMTIPSDNTRVESPYRIKPKIEQPGKTDISRAPLQEQVRRISEAGQKQYEDRKRIEREEEEREQRR